MALDGTGWSSRGLDTGTSRIKLESAHMPDHVGKDHPMADTTPFDLDGWEFARADETLARAAFTKGVWLPPAVYRVMPVLIPYAVRDNSCRKNGSTAKEERWGWPAESGHMRDDNSLLKNLVTYRSKYNLTVQLPSAGGRPAGLPRGWTCSHIWADHHPTANTFVPNLVWLPTAISRLSDPPATGHTRASRVLRAIARAIYGSTEVHPAVAAFAAEGWGRLDGIDDSDDFSPPEFQPLFFDVPVEWILQRVESVEAFAKVAHRRARGLDPTVGVDRGGLRKWAAGAATVPTGVARALADNLERYVLGVRTALLDYPAS